MYMENNTIGMQLPVQTNFLVLILTPLIPSSALYMYIIYGVLIDCFWSYGTAKKKRPGYLVGNLVATNWPIEKALHAIGYNQIPTK